jgi:hypothetical protein
VSVWDTSSYNLSYIELTRIGVTGLLIVQGLKKSRPHCLPHPLQSPIPTLTHPKNNISFSIFESESAPLHPRSREWGMSIYWSRPLLQSLLDILYSKIREAQVDPSYDTENVKCYIIPFYNGETGEHIVDIPIMNPIRFLDARWERSVLRGLMSRYVPP